MEEQLLFSIKEIFLHVTEGTTRYTKQEEQKLLQASKKLSQLYMLALCEPQAQQGIDKTVIATQQLLSFLLNQLHQQQRNKPNTFLLKLSDELIAFFEFVQTNSGTWFNDDMPMPILIWQPIKQQLTAQMEKGPTCLFSNIDPILLNILQEVFKQTTSAPAPTQACASYWQQLMQALLQSAQDQPLNSFTCINILFRYNFNHPLLIEYVYRDYLDGLSHTQNAVTYWQEILLHINRIVPLHQLSLLKQEASCYSILKYHIQTELSVLASQNERVRNTDIRTPYAFKLSVAQMAVFFRAQVEAGMIMQDNTTEMIRHLSESLPTSRNGTIGFKSFYNKYHDPDRAAIQIMLEYNTRMQQFLKSQLI